MVSPLVPDFSQKPYEVYQGDAFEVVPRLAAGGVKVDCVVTSPPYFNQRTYGDDGKELGQEKLLEEFVDNLVRLFKMIPVEPWANFWINIGNKRDKNGALYGVPNHFVIAMQKAGFYLMDDVVWAKEVVSVEGDHIGHCMIEPANRRLNGNGWEPFYRFVVDPKQAWADTCAVMIGRDNHPSPRYRSPELMQCHTAIEGRNLTNVWSIGTSRKGKAHFAAYPAALVERPIAMSCPEHITKNGPRERIVQPTVYDDGRRVNRAFGQYTQANAMPTDESTLTPEERENLDALRRKSGRMDTARQYVPKYPKTMGWTHDDVPVLRKGIVLDPFGGTGTTGEVAIKLGRNFIGTDLYPEFAERMTERCAAAFETYKMYGQEDDASGLDADLGANGGLAQRALTDSERAEFIRLTKDSYDPELWTDDDLPFLLRVEKEYLEAQRLERESSACEPSDCRPEP